MTGKVHGCREGGETQGLADDGQPVCQELSPPSASCDRLLILPFAGSASTHVSRPQTLDDCPFLPLACLLPPFSHLLLPPPSLCASTWGEPKLWQESSRGGL